ncbi:MAG TPA: TonB-dependent receptor [Blastocatellia bacterium]|nr:TonB-dependent receptor [Blastocatellia bacterium]
MKVFRQMTILFALLLLGASVAFAQQNSGSLSGTVTDTTAGVVPAATVTATNTDTGLRTETVSTGAGVYVFASLPVGIYEVSVEKTGFKKLNRKNIEIRVAQRLTLDLQLEVGNVAEIVEVTAQGPLLETETSEKGQNFSNKMMSTLPLFTGGIRSAATFVTYMPGVNSYREVSVSGSGGRGKEVMIDGASLTIPESGGVVFNFPGTEMFQEFKLVTAAYSAEYGRFGGGVETYVTKSGGNDIHGAAFWYARRDIWNANAWARNAANQAKPKERFNEAGFAVGGPARIPWVYDGRNKTFWFVTYSRDMRPATISTVTSTVPTVKMKNGDFSEVGRAIYDPTTTVGNVRTQFANNLIPANRISAISKKFLAALPDPNLPGVTNNFAFVNESQVLDNVWSLKLDHAITSNNRISYFHSFQNNNTASTTALPGPLGQGLGASTQRPQNFRVNHDWIVRPNFLIHTTFGFSRTQQAWDNPAQAGFASQAGLKLPTDATPRVQFTGADGLTPWGVQDGKVNNGGQNNWTTMVTQNISWVRGKHEYRMGWDVRRLRTIAFDAAGTNGLFNFERAQTALPSATGTTGHSFASFLLGAPNQVSFTTLPYPDVQIRYGYHAGYFQDNWKIKSNLTLNLGMRYEVPVGWHMANYQMSGVDLKLPNPAAGGLPGALIFAGNGTGRTGTKRFYPTDFSNIGPRLGFAYKVASKTVVRGGFGIYYQTLGNGGCGCNLGFGGPPGTLVADGVNPAVLWDAGLPIPQGAKPPFIDPGFGVISSSSAAGTLDYFSPDFGKAPRIYNWSLNVQHEIKGFLLDIAYVGNRGRGLASSLFINQVDPKYLSLGTLLRQRIDSPAVIAAGFKKPYAAFPDSATLAQALRPFPQYNNVVERNSGDGQSWYDSLQIKGERRFGSWQLMASYVWSKSLGKLHYRQIFSQTQTSPQNNYDLSDAKSLLAFDQPHMVNILNSFDLPFGRGKKFFGSSNRAVDTIIGGWSLGVINRYAAGGPLDIVAPNTLGNGTLFTQYKKANLTGVAIRTGIDRKTLDPNNASVRYFGCTPEAIAGQANRFQCAANSTPFSIPGEFAFGTASQFMSDFRQTPVFTENISIVKRINITGDGRVKFVYRADIFNLFNRTNFAVNGTIGNADFGRATGPQHGPRVITMGGRLEF